MIKAIVVNIQEQKERVGLCLTYVIVLDADHLHLLTFRLYVKGFNDKESFF